MVINPLVNTMLPGQVPPAGGQPSGDAFAAILSAAPPNPQAQLAVVSTAPLPLHAELPVQAQSGGEAPLTSPGAELAPTTTNATAIVPTYAQPDETLSTTRSIVRDAMAESPAVMTLAPATIDATDDAPEGAGWKARPMDADTGHLKSVPEGTPTASNEPSPALVSVLPVEAHLTATPNKQAVLAVTAAGSEVSRGDGPAERQDEEPIDPALPAPIETVLPAIAEPEPATYPLPALGVDPAPVQTGEKGQQLAGEGTKIAAGSQVASATDRIVAAVEPIRLQDSAPVAPASEHAPVADGTHERVAAPPTQTTMQPAQAQAASIQSSATAQPQVERTLPFRPDRIGERMGVEVARAITDGKEELVVRLDPAELGRINIRMRFDECGALRAVVAAESTIVAEAIRRDTVELTRALTDAGVRADTQSFRFDRGTGGEAGAGGQWQQQRGHSHGRSFAGSHKPVPAEDQRPLRLSASGRIDLIA